MSTNCYQLSNTEAEYDAFVARSRYLETAIKAHPNYERWPAEQRLVWRRELMAEYDRQPFPPMEYLKID